MIPYGRQTISDDDINAVVAVLKSDYLTQGPVVPRFEKAVADYCKVSHAIAVNSATSALHIACLALGVGPGDRVWTSPNTFVASANCARYCGADVDFVDIDATTYNLCPKKLEEKLASAERTDSLPKVVIPVHFAGQPCDMASIATLAKRYGFRVVEDASHAIGARYRNTVTGDCYYSDITVFSFHPVKIITTGEGGMCTTKCPQLARRMQLLRSHGITRDIDEMENKNEGLWYYEQKSLGYNYRMTDLQAALGLSQLTQLDNWIANRHAIAERYDDLLAKLPITLPVQTSNAKSSLHLYPIQVENRKAVFAALRERGIGVNVHYIPVHVQPYYKAQNAGRLDLKRSELYYSRAISLPIFSSLTDSQISHVVNSLNESICT